MSQTILYVMLENSLYSWKNADFVKKRWKFNDFAARQFTKLNPSGETAFTLNLLFPTGHLIENSLFVFALC